MLARPRDIVTRDWSRLRHGRYGVILLDPPWTFRPREWSSAGLAKSPARHYLLMSADGINTIPVGQLAAPDCFLVTWATQAQLHHALAAVKAWGFTFKSAGAWAKESKTGSTWAFGQGFIFRSAAEFFLAATRGSPQSAVANVRNLIVAPVREHSRKPDEMHDNLERMFPAALKCELFARRPRPGFDTWGDEL
jgi:N6-adenosine-specific RNA methylase IME4